MKRLIYFLIIFPLLVYGDYNPNEAKQYVNKHLSSWLGWCSEEKAHAMMDLIFETKPEICVEIGVFGGSSLFPTAYALKCLGSGIIYGIDPWNAEECIRNLEENDPNYKWWSEQDMQYIYLDFLITLRGYQLKDPCKIIRDTSKNAIELIPEYIDILHIDGNFSEESVLEDAILYLPKVRKGGYIWINDIHWVDLHSNFTKEKALKYLKKKCSVVREYDNYILLKKR